MITDAMIQAALDKQVSMNAVYALGLLGSEDTDDLGDYEPEEIMRAALEAALAVQPVPTDAEIEAAIERYGDADVCYKECSDDINYGDGAWESSVAASRGNRDAARANLLRLIAQQQPKKVFLAVRPDYEGLSIYGVFLTEGEAEQRVRELGVEDHRVYDYEVGVPL